MRSNPANQLLFFIFLTRKYFTKVEFLDFVRSLDRFKGLIRVIISGVYMAWTKKITKFFTDRRRDICPPHVETG